MTSLALLLLALAPARAGDIADGNTPIVTQAAPGDPVGGVRVETDENGQEHIVVYGDLRVEEARKAVIDDLHDLGYDKVIDKGDYVLLRNEQAWKGDIILHDDGWIRMKRQPLRLESRNLPWADEGSPLAWASCALYPPMCIRSGGVLVSKRKFMAQQGRTLHEIEPDVQSLGDRVADAAVDERINDLPDKLERLWADGVPLDGQGAALATVADRKKAILAYWDSRTDTVWGDRVRLAVEAFLRGEVQGTADAFTADEIAAFNAHRHCERELDLDRDWEEVQAEVEAEMEAQESSPRRATQ